MSLETGMLLLHKHGHDCMLVSPPYRSHQAYSRLTSEWPLSTKGGKSRPERNGLSGRICASRGDCVLDKRTLK